MKVIRPTYPKEFSIGLLMLIFVLAFFLSGQLFVGSANAGKNHYPGMFLASAAVVIMLLVLWEEFLFPIHVKPLEDTVVFRNHRNKLKSQLLIFLTIPVIFGVIYYMYEVNLIRFIVWATVCIASPVLGKLISGIRNYNDFLKLTNDSIEYKNNAEVGLFNIKDVQRLILIKDESNVLHKIQVELKDGKEVIIDLDEMELEAYYNSIYEFISSHSNYKSLVALKTSKVEQ